MNHEHKPAYSCINHPNREAIVHTAGGMLCWQCWLGQAVFEQRFGRNFYGDESTEIEGGVALDIREIEERFGGLMLWQSQ